MALDFDRIDGIIWDLDNTLYRFTEEFRHQCNVAAAKAAQSRGIKLSYDDTLKLAQKSESEHGYSLHFYITHHGFSYESLHLLFHDNIDETTIDLIDGAAEALRHLTLKQTILTNASACWAKRVLDHIGIRDLFPDPMITASEDVDFEVKASSRRGFDRALDALGLEAKNVLIVDDLDRNLVIPHEMGMQTAYICYDDPMPDLPHYIDAQCENAIEVLESVKA